MYVKNLKNSCGSPEIGTTCWLHVDLYIPVSPRGGGCSKAEACLGRRRLVSLLPVAQRTNAVMP